MNIKQVTDKLLHNWAVKLLCLVVAIFLYIFHEASLIEKKNFLVPLTIVENGEVMHIGDCASKITVTVKALPNDIPEIHLNDFKAKLDLSFIPESGVYEVPVQVDVSDTIKLFDKMEIRAKPSTISVRVEKKISKFIPLEPSVSGEVGYGYMIDSISMDPSTVCVVGPESIVNSINKVYTDKIVVSNAEVNFTTEVNYLELNKMVYVANKGPYKATVTVVPQESKKEFNEVPIEVSNLSSNLKLEGNLPLLSVELGGPKPVLEDYSLPRRAFYIDLSNISEPGTYEVPLNKNINSSLSLEKISKQFITITIVDNVVEETEKEESQE